MNQNRLFHSTRTRLAFWYALVMGLILSLCGGVAYNAMAHAAWVAIEHELELVAGTLHDGIEPTLSQPGRLSPEVGQLLPDICLATDSSCSQTVSRGRHILGAIHQSDYYMRLFDSSGRLIAFAGVQLEELPATRVEDRWQTLLGRSGIRYCQISQPLHTLAYVPWGYMQVGRSLKDFDEHVAVLRWILGLGLPGAMGLVAISSWWLSGLAMRPIRRSYLLLQQFTADAAHELRTPLAALQATVESIFPIPPDLSSVEARDTQQTIERQINRLSQLVKDLLLLCRMDQQALPVKLLPCCLNDVIGDLVEEFEDLATAADVKLSADLRVRQPLYIMGDVEQLYRLISNLIVNAIQYTSTGGEVRVVLESSDEQALIQIQDTGIGIPLKEQTRIFERFYRVSGDRSRSTGGSGLGLAIAMVIVQAHGGSLLLQSVPGKGSTFTIQLPLSSFYTE